MSKLPEIQGYEITDEIGKGGMATVYKGIYNKLERIVAIKVLSPHFLHEENFAKRFLKEAKISAGLNHPNIITIFDVDNNGDYHYIVTEYFSGGTLKDMILSNKITPELALSIVKSIASALDYAHGKGFIHRDIKPDNIMFREDGTPVLVDFGIARAVGSATKLTKTGMSIGTPHYMSPEQSRGKPLDGRSDIYSLGVVLYEMLTGKLPYEAEDSDSIAIAIKHIQDPIPDLRSEVRGQRVEAGAIEHLQNLINKMMAKDPNDRAQSGREVIERLSKPSAFSLQLSADKNKIETPENLIGLNGASPENIKAGNKITSAENLDSPYSSNNKRKRTIKILASVLSVSLIVLLLFLFLKNSKRKIDEDSWAEAMRVHSIYSFENYLRKNPDSQYSSKARWWINTLKTETEASKRKDEQNKRERDRELIRENKRRIETKIKREEEQKRIELFETLKRFEQQKEQNRLANEHKHLVKLEELKRLEEKKNKEYSDLFNLAKTNLDNNEFEKALENIQSAREINDTDKLNALEEQVKTNKTEFLRKEKEEEIANMIKKGQPIPLESVTQKPVKKEAPEPVFSEAIQKKYKGQTITVDSNILINENGNIDQVKILGKVPTDLKLTIFFTLASWKYKPGKWNKKNVKVRVKVTNKISF